MPADPSDPPPLSTAELAQAVALYRDMLLAEKSGFTQVVISLHRPYRVRPVGKPLVSVQNSAKIEPVASTS